MRYDIPIPRTPRSDTRHIHRLLTRDDPGHLDALLVAHAGAVSSAPSLAAYQRYMDRLQEFAQRHGIALWALRDTLGLIRTGTYSRTFPLAKRTEGTCLQDMRH